MITFDRFFLAFTDNRIYVVRTLSSGNIYSANYNFKIYHKVAPGDLYIMAENLVISYFRSATNRVNAASALTGTMIFFYLANYMS